MEQKAMGGINADSSKREKTSAYKHITKCSEAIVFLSARALPAIVSVQMGLGARGMSGGGRRMLAAHVLLGRCSRSLDAL